MIVIIKVNFFEEIKKRNKFGKMLARLMMKKKDRMKLRNIRNLKRTP